MIPHFSVIASKGFWAEILGVGDFYYEVKTSHFSMNEIHI